MYFYGIFHEVTILQITFAIPYHFNNIQVRLSDNDVEKERSIVVEEWRQSRSGAQRAGDDYFQILTKVSSQIAPNYENFCHL